MMNGLQYSFEISQSEINNNKNSLHLQSVEKIAAIILVVKNMIMKMNRVKMKQKYLPVFLILC